MTQAAANPGLVAFCGLYCGACSAFLKEKCKGCHENVKAIWCKVRVCCMERHYASCAECSEFPDVRQCRKYNNLMAKIFGLLFNSDRAACIAQVRSVGLARHAELMGGDARRTFPRRGRS
jgi:hypothetical protein